MAHIGDSRAYLLRDGELTQVSTDHTFVQHLVNTGKITAEEAERHPQRSVLLRVLGDFDMEIVPDLSVRETRPGDRWLLCSDGLSGVVSHDTITQTLLEEPDTDACADQLVALALRGGAPDNVTVVLGDVVEVDALPDGAAPGTTSHVVGAAAVDRSRPTLGDAGAAGRAAQLTAAVRAGSEPVDAAGPVDEDEPAPRRTGRRVATAVAVLLLLGGLVAAGLWGYGWTQQQYFLGVDDGRIAVFRGIPQSVGPFELSRAVEISDTRVADLPGYARDRLAQTIPVDSLDDARNKVDELELEADDAS
ncbi:MAG TPA: serine/threonine-protein phosphatase, partial [Actinotalea sp.]|nr:serine/threonine-protein phosphatase [Actinotalea sp.]